MRFLADMGISVRTVEWLRQQGVGGYGMEQTLDEQGTIAPLACPDGEIAVGESLRSDE
jgi:hypothetical protein